MIVFESSRHRHLSTTPSPLCVRDIMKQSRDRHRVIGLLHHRHHKSERQWVTMSLSHYTVIGISFKRHRTTTWSSPDYRTIVIAPSCDGHRVNAPSRNPYRTTTQSLPGNHVIIVVVTTSSAHGAFVPFSSWYRHRNITYRDHYHHRTATRSSPVI